ncbi:hypothetical protein V6U89_23480 [Micromonospora sp. CPCC 206171]|uniref:hypothetical protein n=1 Tax=Micromonospora sp. CPCC 206171 TaxID=3122405 RepID=UPI002FF07CB2
MDAHQAGYLVGRLACLVVPLLLIVGLVVLGVVLAVRKGRPAPPPHHPGGFHPAPGAYPTPPYPTPPPPGQAYPVPAPPPRPAHPGPKPHGEGYPPHG